MAEAATHVGFADEGVHALAGLLSADQTDVVRLQAINALTYVAPDHARKALHAITAARGDSYLFVKNCAIYLEAVLTGRYHPSMPIFDLDGLRKKSGVEG